MAVFRGPLLVVHRTHVTRDKALIHVDGWTKQSHKLGQQREQAENSQERLALLKNGIAGDIMPRNGRRVHGSRFLAGSGFA